MVIRLVASLSVRVGRGWEKVIRGRTIGYLGSDGAIFGRGGMFSDSLATLLPLPALLSVPVSVSVFAAREAGDKVGDGRWMCEDSVR